MQNDYTSWGGRDLVGADGSKIGTIDQLYADKDSGAPTFMTVNTGMFGSRTSFVPVDRAESTGNAIRVPFDKDMIKNAPNIDPDADITPQEEDQLYQYYSMSGTSGFQGGTGQTGGAGFSGGTGNYETGTVGHDTSGPSTDSAMTRSEERLNVGVERAEAGRARLRKFVTTEQVSQTVPVTREEVRIEREPITEGNVGNAMDGPAISEEVHEVTLNEERPVVQKEAVPVERIRVDKEQVTEQVQVSDTVAKEQIELDEGVRTGQGIGDRGEGNLR